MDKTKTKKCIIPYKMKNMTYSVSMHNYICTYYEHVFSVLLFIYVLLFNDIIIMFYFLIYHIYLCACLNMLDIYIIHVS